VLPTGRGLELRLAAAAALSLLVVAALGFGLLRLLPPSQREAQAADSAARASQAPEALLPVTDPAPPPVALPPPKQPSAPAPAVPPAPELSPAPDAPPHIIRTEPEEPRAGKDLIITLGGGEKVPNAAFQYRILPEELWQPAAGGVITLKALKPGTVALEIRIVGSAGRASPVARRVWTVPPLPSAEPRGPGLEEGDTFYQEVVVARVSRYRMADVDLGQNVQYSFVSRLTVTKKEPDGTLKVRQKVEAARLAEAERGPQAQLNELLQKTRGATFLLTLNPRREVVAFEGGQEALKVFEGVNALGGSTFLLWSFLDRDGWKELAELSFFQPRPEQRWTRPVRHSWGPLGRWQGQAAYARAGGRQGRDRYDYVLDLAYRPAAPGGAALPFLIDRADFRVQNAGGSITFDPRRGRVAVAEERFAVRGLLVVTALGAEVPVDMDEVQLFQLRLHDRNPLDRGPAQKD
jgi:hypothetical protein